MKSVLQIHHFFWDISGEDVVVFWEGLFFVVLLYCQVVYLVFVLRNPVLCE